MNYETKHLLDEQFEAYSLWLNELIQVGIRKGYYDPELSYVHLLKMDKELGEEGSGWLTYFNEGLTPEEALTQDYETIY